MKFTVHKIGRGGWTEWIMPRRKNYQVKCCACGLVHETQHSIRNGRVVYRARRLPNEPRRSRA